MVMSDINRVTDFILQKASEEAEKVTKEADAKYKTLMEQAGVEAQNEYNRIINDAQTEAILIRQRAESQTEKNSLQNILKLKNRFVNECIESAKNRIYEMSDKDYFEFIENLFNKYAKGCRIVNNASEEKAFILFNERDKSRIPETLKKMFDDCKLNLGEESVDIDGGFILRSGKVEENCSVSAIFRDKKDLLTDYISKELFL